MFQFVIIPFMLLIVQISGQSAPAFLWGTPSSLQPALQRIDKDAFASIISSKLDNAMALVFIENDLEPKDFSMCRNKMELSCFENLKKFENHNYLADVELPLNALQDLNNEQQSVMLNSTGETSEPIEYKAGKIVFLTLDDSGNARSSILTEHDSVMAKIYNSLSKMGKILAIYTSHPIILTRQIREVVTPRASTTKISQRLSYPGKFLLSHNGLELEASNGELETITLNTPLTISDESKTGFKIKIPGTKEVTLNVKNQNGYFVIDQINIADVIFPVALEAAKGFSYYCGTLKAATASYTLKWSNLQLQPNFYENIKEIKSFDDPWHCTGFMSIGILMGLFVTVMFLLIISIGITWMMDINTMDRFDDPKGKTITINAE